MTGGRIILVANNFPPVRGGSSMVYDCIARHDPDRIIVVAPRRSYVNGLTLIGWREQDRHAPNRIRLDLLRTRLDRPRRGMGHAAFLLSDLLIRARLVWTVLWLILTRRATALCVGELLASSWLLALFRWLPVIRTVAYVHGEEITTADPYDPGHRRARAALLAADAIVVVSRFTRQAVADLAGRRAETKTTLIENGIESSRFPAGGKPADLLEHYGLAGCFVFVSVCRLLEKKGIDHAIAAFADAFADDAACRLLIVGHGPFRPALEAIAAARGVSDRVRFTGEVSDEDLSVHYRLGDVFVMPNRRLPNGDTEGFGLVFLEANSSGLPVIAGRDGGSPDAVQHGVNGLVVDGASVPEIAAAMRTLRQDGALRARLAAGGMRIAARADWASRTEAFERVCTGEQRPAPCPAVPGAALQGNKG